MSVHWEEDRLGQWIRLTTVEMMTELILSAQLKMIHLFIIAICATYTEVNGNGPSMGFVIKWVVVVEVKRVHCGPRKEAITFIKSSRVSFPQVV